MFNDADKFDSTNWPTWSTNIMSIAALKSITGYLDGTTKKPPKTASSPPPETPWNSPNPSEDKWEARNAWTKILLTFNTKNPVGLGINIGGVGVHRQKTLGVTLTYVETTSSGVNCTLKNSKGR